jgi:hypothetical protein
MSGCSSSTAATAAVVVVHRVVSQRTECHAVGSEHGDDVVLVWSPGCWLSRSGVKGPSDLPSELEPFRRRTGAIAQWARTSSITLDLLSTTGFQVTVNTGQQG